MNEDLLAYLVAIAVFVTFWLLRDARRRRRPGSAGVAPFREPDTDRVRRLFAMAEKKLGTLGQTDLMLKDFRFRTQLTQAQCKDMQQAQTQLQSMLLELLPHLHLLPDIRLVMTEDPSGMINGALGQYEHSGGVKTIRMLMVPYATPELMAAALCHECTHYFLSSYLLNDPDPKLNEGLTETMACLVGFSEIMIRGDSRREPPYLNRPEFEQLRQLLLAARSDIQQKYDRERNLAAARAQLKKNLTGARSMVEQTQAMIAVNKSPRKRLSQKQLAQLQQTLLSLENGSFAERLKQAERSLTGDLAAVRKADDSVLAVCGELYRLMLAFQG